MSLQQQPQQIAEFIRLLTAHEIRLRAFALSLVPHWADAEEVLQQANLVLWQKFGQFQPGTSFFSWACKVIHLTAKDFRKRQRRERARFSDHFFDAIARETADAEEELSDREVLLGECMAMLKDRQLRLLRLRYDQGGAVAEVAAAMGAKPKAIYAALDRIHKALFDCVERKLAGAWMPLFAPLCFFTRAALPLLTVT